MERDDYQGAVDCVLDTFTNGEPMVNTLKITNDEFKYFAEIYINKAIKDQLSVVAKDGNKVIGAVVSEDLLTEPPTGIEKVSENMIPIFEILTKLDEYYIEQKKPEKGQVLHMFMGSVYKKYAGNNIVSKLVKLTENIAREKHFKQIVVEATGDISRHIFDRNEKFVEVSKIDYKTFEFNGKNIFYDIKGGSACVLFEKSLN